jgi:hypothetical protein
MRAPLGYYRPTSNQHINNKPKNIDTSPDLAQCLIQEASITKNIKTESKSNSTKPLTSIKPTPKLITR